MLVIDLPKFAYNKMLEGRAYGCVVIIVLCWTLLMFVLIRPVTFKENHNPRPLPTLQLARATNVSTDAYFKNLFTKIKGMTFESSNAKLVDTRRPLYMRPARLTEGFQWIPVEPQLENTDLNASMMDLNAMEKFVLRYLKRLQITCPKPARLGNTGDGGWDVCLAGPFNVSKPCLTYSFGIAGDWSFDDTVSTTYSCQDMAFDPSINKSDHKRNPLLWFFNTGIGAVDAVQQRKKWKLRTFPTLLAENNHLQTTVDILKMDIEYAEWESVEAMLNAPDCLRNVKQFMWEFHMRETWSGKNSSASDLVRYWSIARGLDRLGFKVWKVWDNPTCVRQSKHNPGLNFCYCSNVYYINVRYFR